MEPRWKNVWLPELRYLGGSSRVDMFTHSDDYSDIRAAWGDNTSQWHWLEWLDGKLLISVASSHLLKDAPTDEELEELWVYLTIFAPDVVAYWEGKDHGA